jgi:hypothetical protein
MRRFDAVCRTQRASYCFQPRAFVSRASAEHATRGRTDLLRLVREGALVVRSIGGVLPVELGRLEPQALGKLPRVRACHPPEALQPRLPRAPHPPHDVGSPPTHSKGVGKRATLDDGAHARNHGVQLRLQVPLLVDHELPISLRMASEAVQSLGERRMRCGTDLALQTQQSDHAQGADADINAT